MYDDVMRFYDGDGGERPVSVPDYDDWGDWSVLEADARRDADADAVVLAGEVPAVPDVLCPDLSDDELEARGLATSETMSKDGRVRWWEIVAWSESVATDWVSRWDARPDVRGLSIVHNLDVKDALTGELKKSHIHSMAGDSHNRKWSRSQALRFARSVFGLRPGRDDALVRPIKSSSSYALYLTHSNAPEKVQYPRSAVLSFGGADLDSVIGVVDSNAQVWSDIKSWVRWFYGCYECLPACACVSMFADARRPAWSRFLSRSSGAGQLKGYIRSLEYDLGLDGRGAGTVLMVDDLVSADIERENKKLSIS